MRAGEWDVGVGGQGGQKGSSCRRERTQVVAASGSRPPPRQPPGARGQGAAIPGDPARGHAATYEACTTRPGAVGGTQGQGLGAPSPHGRRALQGDVDEQASSRTSCFLLPPAPVGRARHVRHSGGRGPNPSTEVIDTLARDCGQWGDGGRPTSLKILRLHLGCRGSFSCISTGKGEEAGEGRGGTSPPCAGKPRRPLRHPHTRSGEAAQKRQGRGERQAPKKDGKKHKDDDERAKRRREDCIHHTAGPPPMALLYFAKISVKTEPTWPMLLPTLLLW